MFNVYYVSFTLSSIFGDLWLLSLAAINPRSTSLVIKGEPKQDALILNVICKLQFSSSMNVLVDYIIQILGRTGPVIDWIPRKSCCWISALCCLPLILQVSCHTDIVPFLNSPVTSFHCSGSSSLCILVLIQFFDSTKQCVRFPWRRCLQKHFTILTPLDLIFPRRTFRWTYLKQDKWFFW